MAAKNPNPEETDPAESAEPAESRSASEPEAPASHPAEQAIEDAQQAADAISAEAGEDGSLRALDLPDLGGSVDSAGTGGASLSLLRDVNLQVKVELGRTRMYVEDVLRLNEDSVIELDKLAGDPVDIYVNDRHVARGEVLVVNDNFCVRVSEIIQPVAPDD